MTRPRLLDLFCGAGGAAMGYHRAGFDVVGVDIAPQPHYPFEFHQADAMRTLEIGKVGAPFEWVQDFDAIHASPPCQGYSRMRHLPWLKDREYLLLIEPVREHLAELGLPYVIENVEDSPLERRSSLFGAHGVLLCGTMFELRHRPFECSFPVVQPYHPRHQAVIAGGRMLGDRGRVSSWERAIGLPAAMGCDWMNQREVSQAIPPAFTEFIGRQLLEQVDGGHRASLPALSAEATESEPRTT